MEERIYLKKARLKGYKSIIDTEATFLPGINIIIGDNGSGKTNFLEALYESLESFTIKPHTESYTEIEIVEQYESGNKVLSWKTELEKEISDSVVIEERFLDFVTNYNLNASLRYADQYKKISFKGTIYKNVYWELETNFDRLAGNHFFRVNPRLNLSIFKYGFPAYSLLLNSPFSIPLDVTIAVAIAQREPSLDTGLMKFVYNSLSSNLGDNKHAQNLEALQNSIIANFNFVYDKKLKQVFQIHTALNQIRFSNLFSLRKAQHGIVAENIELEFEQNGRWYKWNELSDGTKRITLLIFEVLMNFNGVVLIEEPELGLYPSQLHNLLDFFKEYSDRYQFIITTHSPQVLDILTIKELDRINVAKMTKDGTKIEKLTPEQKELAESFYNNTGIMSDYWRFDNLGLEL